MALTDATRLANFGSGIGTDSTLDILNVNATGIVTAATLKVGSAITAFGGIITATTFSGNAEGLTGTPDITVRNLTGVAATFTGVLTYDDVTNIDSVGIITAKAGLNVVGGGATVTGVSTFFSDVSIADKIIHTGDTNTAIRFPAADTFTVETAGSERVRVDSSGNTGINCTSGGGKLAILANASTYEGLELQTPSGDGSGEFHIGVHQTGTTSGRSIVFKRGGADGMDTESLRIDANGRVTVGGTSASASGPQYSRLQVLGNSFAETTGLFSLRRNEVFGDITAGEDLGVIHFADRTGNTFAEIHGTCDGTPGSSDYPGRLAFYTTSDGASSTTERLRITSTGGFHFTNGELIERAKVTAGKLSDNTNIDLENGMVHLFTTQETTTSTPNIRINSSTSLNSVMATGEMISVTLITTAAAGAYSAQLTIDGGAVTENWTGGSAPSGGGSSGVDIHAYTIIKTADATFTVVATQTKTS